jgi:hypothetical protein
VPENIEDILTRLDALSRAQARVVKEAASEVDRSTSSKTKEAQARDLAQDAHELYLRQWTTIWGAFSSTVLICSKGCSSVSNEATIRALRAGALESLGYAKKAVGLIQTGGSSKLKRQAAQLKADAAEKFRLFDEKTRELPSTQSVCDAK